MEFLIKLYSNICNEPVKDIVNNCIETSYLMQNYHPCSQKVATTKKSNYCHISDLPVVAKLIERILHKQISYNIDQNLSKFQCGYRKGYNAQEALHGSYFNGPH